MTLHANEQTLADQPAPRRTIRFYLGNERVELAGVDPTLTVLDFLRERMRRTGTKEGCNEGDCGACTIVVVRPRDKGLVYRAVNSCIQFVGTLDGAQVLTVEDVKAPDGTLHPVQQAMVECHGSQCGFCTPGFIMSLVALMMSEPDCPSDERIDDILAGNLCRCTGYAPIARAVRRAYDIGLPDRVRAGEAALRERLGQLADGRDIVVGGEERSFRAPATFAGLHAAFGQTPAPTLFAGSTDVGLWVTKQFRPLAHLVWLGRMPELDRIEESADRLTIGAAVPYTEATEALARAFPDFGELLRRLGSVQVRNAGTLGGNVANGSPIGDGSPALIALDATLELWRDGTQRSLPVEQFFIAYGRQDRAADEILVRIVVPKLAPGQIFRAYKVSKRFDQDISAVMGAFRLDFAEGVVTAARLAYGGMAATPKRALAAEAALVGRPWTAASVAAAQAALADDFAPISDMRASAPYRRLVAGRLLDRLFIETTRPQVETRLVGERSHAHA